MTTVSKVLTYTAFGLMALFGLSGALFAAGYAFEDPGGWAAVGIALVWLVPVAVLSVYAVRRPGPSARLLTIVTAVVAALLVLSAAVGLVDRDLVGPVDSGAVLGLAVALAFLGLHRARRAGWLMVATAAAQLLAVTVAALRHGVGEGPPPGAALGGSSGVVVLPVLVVGALFVLAAYAESLSSPAALERPASSLATGTRNGEHET